MLPNENFVNGESDKIIFCRKCGRKLPEVSAFCPDCGTAVERCPDSELSHIDEGSEEKFKSTKKTKRKKRLGKVVLICSLSLILIAAVALCGLLFWKNRVIKQDINTINGCPEFYNIQFNMTASRASKLIELEHTSSEALEENEFYEVSDFMKNSHIFIDEEETFYLFGRKTTDVYIGFDKKYLESVIFTFSQEEYELKDIVSLYKRIYGEPTKTQKSYSTWSGPKTTIDVCEINHDDGEKEIVVRYKVTPNSQYTALSFDGTEIDPCGFLDKNNAFDKKPEYYINGLKKDDDYSQRVYSVQGPYGVVQYTLYPQFEYMGIEQGYTAVALSKEAGEEYIGIVSYEFLLDEENAVNRMNYIYSKLATNYGKAVSCTYTSTNYDKLGVKDISFDEMLKKISGNNEGIYSIQWENNGRRITLSLTISVDKKYYEGSVSFAD